MFSSLPYWQHCSLSRTLATSEKFTSPLVWGVPHSVVVLQRKSFKCKIFVSIVQQLGETETPENFIRPISAQPLSAIFLLSFWGGGVGVGGVWKS